jgi:hypothetical protein
MRLPGDKKSAKLHLYQVIYTIYENPQQSFTCIQLEVFVIAIPSRWSDASVSLNGPSGKADSDPRARFLRLYLPLPRFSVSSSRHSRSFNVSGIDILVTLSKRSTNCVSGIELERTVLRTLFEVAALLTQEVDRGLEHGSCCPRG